MLNNIVNQDGEKNQFTKVLKKHMLESGITERNLTIQEGNQASKLSASRVRNRKMNTEIKERN